MNWRKATDVNGQFKVCSLLDGLQAGQRRTHLLCFLLNWAFVRKLSCMKALGLKVIGSSVIIGEVVGAFFGEKLHGAWVEIRQQKKLVSSKIYMLGLRGTSIQTCVFYAPQQGGACFCCNSGN